VFDRQVAKDSGIDWTATGEHHHAAPFASEDLSEVWWPNAAATDDGWRLLRMRVLRSRRSDRNRGFMAQLSTARKFGHPCGKSAPAWVSGHHRAALATTADRD
jgi:hypothetical protein